MIENIGDILQYGLTLVALLSSVFFFKRARKAEIAIKELEVERGKISTADEMIELVKKAHAEVLQLKQELADASKKQADEYKKEIEKLCRYIARLEKALKAVNNCRYRDECPVPELLQSYQEGDPEPKLIKS